MAATESSGNGSGSPSLRGASPIDVETLIDRWVQRLERFPEPRAAERIEPARPPQAPPKRAAPAATGPTVVQFEGEASGIPLSNVGGRIVHRGSIGLRGPCAPGPQLWSELGVGEPLRIAFDHVATWYGGAFDSVNLRSDAPLSWGVWHLSGSQLAHALASFRGRGPEQYQASVAAFGVGTDGDGEPRMTLRTGFGTLLRANAAERAIAGDPRLVAALARAARHAAARAAQIETALERSVRPMLATDVALLDGSRQSLGQLLRGPRQLAIALHAAIAGGPRAVQLLCKSLGAGSEAGIEAYLDGLAGAPAPGLLLGARRILSTAELDIA